METLQLPNIEERDDTRPELPPVNFIEQEIDLAAFRLWQEASRMDKAAEE